ncbi:hypothetical protein I5G62_gp65 [Mycobacterium phage CRB2]|uniref:Uncharacterized protein n=1 Tax=Mycobacterium phage CRB2 TaxID=2483623 RepID=A0A455M8B9_9CAUD|nr:hypothetical protein I5G62_gp65 [Mycobacterium phage CRB2]AYP70051.1 hypothetical protein CRB2_65 [Mycobacterium phage CRB2]
MTTTKRKGVGPTKKARRATETVYDETLAEFSRALDSHLHRPAGFAEAVLELHRIRRTRAILRERRSEIFSRLREHAERGNTFVRISDTEAYELRRTTPAAQTVTKTVTSAAAVKAGAGLWEAARVITPYVQVKSPVGAVPDLPLPAMPEVPPSGVSLAGAVAAYRSVPKDAELRNQEEEIITALEKIAADAGWDGEPVTFGDGWVVGLRRKEYSSDQLKANDPAAWDALATPVIKGGHSRLYLAKVNAAGEASEEWAD